MQRATICLPIAAAVLFGCGDIQEPGEGESSSTTAGEEATGDGDIQDTLFGALAIGPNAPAPPDPADEDEEEELRDAVTVATSSYGVVSLGAAPSMPHCALNLELGVIFQGASGPEALHIDFDVYGYDVGEDPIDIEFPSTGGWVSAVRCVADDCYAAESAWLGDASGSITVRDLGATWEISDVDLTFASASDGQPVTVKVAFAEIADPYGE